MTEQLQIEKSTAMAREWFTGHVATDNNFGVDALGSEVRVINWRRPDTGSYSIKFILVGRYVIATGDLGEAVYGFGCAVSSEFLLKCDWHYFINKCVASETGRHYTMKVPGINRPVPNVRALAHFIGLQMSLKQLQPH